MNNWQKKFKFIIITLAFSILCIIVLSNVFKTTQVSTKDFQTYQQGLYYLKNNDLENAYFNFNNVSKNSAIYEIALLRQALCADELKDSDTATKKYRLFIEKFPESIFVQKAYYSLAQNYYRTKEYSKAEKTFNEIKKNFKDSEYAIASNYYLGLIVRDKDIQKAKNYFIEYIKNVQNGRHTIASINEINNLCVELEKDDYLYIGKAYLKNGIYKSALKSLEQSDIDKAWAGIVIANKKLRNYESARITFENNYGIYSDNIDTDELQNTIETYASINNNGIQNGYDKALDIASSNNAKGQDFILYRLSKLVNKQERLAYYYEIYKNHPHSQFASESLFNLFWNAYTNGQFKEAQKLGSNHIKAYPYTIAAPKILFWMGKLSEKNGRRNEARGFYERILETYPDDYYAYRAAKKLSNAGGHAWKTRLSHKLPLTEQAILFPIKYTQIPDDYRPLINTIIKLGDNSLLAEIDTNNKIIQSWLFYNEGKYATAASIARDEINALEVKPAFTDNIYKLAYQLHHQDVINSYSKYYDLDSYLVTALIREESYFNTQANSSVGAIGLMQLMPTTAAYIASTKNIAYNSPNNLYDPNKNIQLGCAYLSYAKEKLHNNDLLAVAAYNGGPNAVKSWRDKMDYENFDEFIEHIPYPETKEYIKKVYRSYWVYLNIY